MIYTIIAVFNSYFFFYLPFYFYDVLKVEHDLLAIIQMMVLLTPVFLPPILGFMYDKITKNVHVIISIACFMLPFVFLFVLVNMVDIFNFFLFFTLAYSAIWLIRGGMIKHYMNALSSGTKETQTKIMTKTVLISQSSSIFGTLLTMLFYFSITDIASVDNWRMFLFLGFFVSLPILFSVFLKTSFLPDNRTMTEPIKDRENNMKSKKKYYLLIPLISTFLLMFFTETDELYHYSVPSWVGNTFGFGPLDLYFKTIIISYLCAILGNYLANKLYSRFIKRLTHKDKELSPNKQEEMKDIFIRKILFILFLAYQGMLWLSFSSDFIIFIVIWWTILPILGSALKIYLSFLISTQAIQLKKYKTMAYMLQISIANIGMLVFTPLGIFLYPILGMNSLVLISITLSTFYLIINLQQIRSSKK